MFRVLAPLVTLFLAAAILFGDFENDPFPADMDHPAIQYSSRPASDPVAQLNAKLLSGTATLKFAGEQGYLRSVLAALNVPIESQLVVFSKTSVQMQRITPANPRSLFFNDSVVVGWVRGGPIIELAAEDPTQGTIFYTLDESPVDHPQFVRRDSCLSCHLSFNTLDVPGTLVRSVFTTTNGNPIANLGNYITDDRSAFSERWGGWYVTGLTGSMKHMGNETVNSTQGRVGPGLFNQDLNLESLKGKFDTGAYLTPYSDVVALMAFEHEMHTMNLLTRVGWEARLAEYNEKAGLASHDAAARILSATARELVDYMLFVDEVPLTGKVQGTSGFAEMFSAEGPRDSEGRSLRQLDLRKRLMRYPCSYMIYSDAFDALPAEAKSAVYGRMWQILSGQENSAKYRRLLPQDRRAVIEILRQTKTQLPDYFR